MIEINDIVAYLIEKYHPKAILLHGSRARGDAVEQSDYDFVLIAEKYQMLCPEFYKSLALDIRGVSPLENILKSGQTPIWPCKILFDDADYLGKRLAKNTHEEFKKGPPALTRGELENRYNFSKRLIQRIQGRGQNSLMRSYYMGDFYQRILRYWCELHQYWSMSVHVLLPRIAREDPLFYQYLENLWTEDYQKMMFKIHHHLFKIREKKSEICDVMLF